MTLWQISAASQLSLRGRTVVPACGRPVDGDHGELKPGRWRE